VLAIEGLLATANDGGERGRGARISVHNDDHGILNEEICDRSGAAFHEVVTVFSFSASCIIRKVQLALSRCTIAVGELCGLKYV
jgi:hypothetical protein